MSFRDTGNCSWCSMASGDCYCDYESGLQHELARWSCIRHAECQLDFTFQPRYMNIELNRTVLWSIQAAPLDDQRLTPPVERRYIFSIRDLTLRGLTSDRASYNHLPFHALFQSPFTFFEALESLEWYSGLVFSAPSEDPGRRDRWLMILDAEIAAVSCATAREATVAAGKAAAAALSECRVPLEACELRIQERAESGSGFERWLMDGWSVADEFWASGFSKPREDLLLRKNILCRAAEEGNVLQWCGVRVHRGPHPSFEFHVELQQFLQGDDVLLRMGIANDRPLRVRLSLTENVEVVCSQAGVEPGTSLGLGYLLPDAVREHALGMLRARDGMENAVERLLQRVVGYLAFAGSRCIVCGSPRILEVPLTSACGNICRARRLIYATMASRAAKEEDKCSVWKRRERFVRCKFPHTTEGSAELGRLLGLKVVPIGSNPKAEENEIGYELAVQRVASLENGRDIAAKLGVELSPLWSADEER